MDAIREEGLDALLDGSKFSGIHRSSLVRGAASRAAFDIYWDGMRYEAEYEHELFFLYEYDSGRVYPCDAQVGYVSLEDRQTHSAFDVLLQLSAMSLEQYRAHSVLFAEHSPLYVREAWMHRASSPRPAPPPQVAVDEGAHEAYDSYAMDEDPSVPTATGDDNRDGIPPRASASSGIDLKPPFDRITTLAGENVAAQREMVEKEKRIKELE